MIFAGQTWQPTKLERIVDVLDTSMKPLKVLTDQGIAIVKYMGNVSHNELLLCELVGCEITRSVGLTTPDFAILNLPHMPIPSHFVQVTHGPAFLSRWIESVPFSPQAGHLRNLRDPYHVALLVVLDTWLRNPDRVSARNPHRLNKVELPNENYDNLLIKKDKRKVELIVIDHSHSFVETTLEDGFGDAWVEDSTVYGLFEQFRPLLNYHQVLDAIDSIERIDERVIGTICASVPSEWGMSPSLAEKMTSAIVRRGRALKKWMPEALFDQREMDLR